MTSKEKKLLFENPLFKSLSGNFSEIAGGFTEDTFKKGDIIFSSESFERCLVFILKGRVSVRKVGVQGKRTALNELSSGELFGMAALFYEADYPSEIAAETACKVAVFPKETVEHLIAELPDFAREYIVLLSKKIHFLNSRLGTFAESEVPEKLLSFLKNLGGGKTEFTLDMSVSHLAESLGVGRASVYRAFDALAEENILLRKGKTIVIQSPERVNK